VGIGEGVRIDTVNTQPSERAELVAVDVYPLLSGQIGVRFMPFHLEPQSRAALHSPLRAKCRSEAAGWKHRCACDS